MSRDRAPANGGRAERRKNEIVFLPRERSKLAPERSRRRHGVYFYRPTTTRARACRTAAYATSLLLNKRPAFSSGRQYLVGRSGTRWRFRVRARVRSADRRSNTIAVLVVRVSTRGGGETTGPRDDRFSGQRTRMKRRNGDP